MIDLGEQVLIFCKGAPEILLELSTHFINQAGNIQSLDDISKGIDFYLVRPGDQDILNSFRVIH